MTTQSIIISHKEDLDGIVSAALLKQVKMQEGYPLNAIKIMLVNYREICGTFSQLIPLWTRNEILVADLGINVKFVRVLEQIPKIDISVPKHYYFDHHHIPEDLGAIVSHIKAIFHEYTNSVLDSVSYGDNFCTAEIVLRFFHLENNSHFSKLARIAHLMDFPANHQDPLWNLAGYLKKVINYYQNDLPKLNELIDAMQTHDSWEEFTNCLPQKLEEIDRWMQSQYKYINENKQIICVDDLKVIAAVADLRAGEITHYIQDQDASYDIYIGLSKKEQYMNVRVKKPVAHLIAAEFGGGGHPDRGGFEIPDRYLKFYLEDSKRTTIPTPFIDEILHIFQKYATNL